MYNITYSWHLFGKHSAVKLWARSIVTCKTHSSFKYFNAICTCAASLLCSKARDASNTPESPATDSLLTAADTDRVFDADDVRLNIAANEMRIFRTKMQNIITQGRTYCVAGLAVMVSHRSAIKVVPINLPIDLPPIRSIALLIAYSRMLCCPGTWEAQSFACLHMWALQCCSDGAGC